MTVVSDEGPGSVAKDVQALSARVDRAKVGVEARAQAITSEPQPIGDPSPSTRPHDDRDSGGRRPWRVLILVLVLVLLAAGATMIIGGRNGSGGRASNGAAATNATVAANLPSSAATANSPPGQALPGSGTQGATPVPAPAPGPSPTVNDALPNAATTVNVAAGDNFWSIAERVVSARVSAPTTSDVASYWVELVQANQGNLAQAGHPDLIYVGQTFSLP